MKDYSILNGYMDDDGKFSKMPGKKQKKRQALMLQFLSEKFDADKEYTEIEVNDILNQYHSFEDPASLRRLMWGSGLINRTLDGRKYWLPKESV